MTNDEWVKEAIRLTEEYGWSLATGYDAELEMSALLAHLSARPEPQAALSDERLQQLATNRCSRQSWPNSGREWTFNEQGLHDYARAVLAASRHDESPALGYATRLAEAIWRKHYATDAPNWKPLPDLLGVLTQIDNMTSGLAASRQVPVIPAGAVLERLKYHWQEADPEMPDIPAMWEAFPPDVDCETCIPVLVVRADAVKVSPLPVGEPRQEEGERSGGVREDALRRAGAAGLLPDPDVVGVMACSATERSNYWRCDEAMAGGERCDQQCRACREPDAGVTPAQGGGQK